MAIHQQIQFVLRTTLIYINVGSHILPSHLFASIRVVGAITKCKLLHSHHSLIYHPGISMTLLSKSKIQMLFSILLFVHFYHLLV